MLFNLFMPLGLAAWNLHVAHLRFGLAVCQWGVDMHKKMLGEEK